jgi:hypothetical protein
LYHVTDKAESSPRIKKEMGSENSFYCWIFVLSVHTQTLLYTLCKCICAVSDELLHFIRSEHKLELVIANAFAQGIQ